MTGKPLRILHLASFSGNVGDNANHAGFRPWLEAMVEQPVEWRELEIREFYWRERAFDGGFVDLANQHDLLVIGGGNYFELWVEDSGTGTSIDIHPRDFGRIRTPIFFNALGVDAGQGVSEANAARFKAFMESLLASDQYLVTVRNDGATRTLAEFISPTIADAVGLLPDGGFFADFASSRTSYHEPGRTAVGINLARDMADVRFGNGSGASGYDAFCDSIAQTIAMICGRQEVDVVLFPHIYSDLAVLSDVVDRLPDRLRRTRLSVAPYSVGSAGAQRTFGGYAACALIMGMRFHSNVCPIGMGIPTIGLNSYRQIELLYEELSFPDGWVDVSSPGFEEALAARATAVIEDPAELRSRVSELKARVEDQRGQLAPVVGSWLARTIS